MVVARQSQFLAAPRARRAASPSVARRAPELQPAPTMHAQRPGALCTRAFPHGVLKTTGRTSYAGATRRPRRGWRAPAGRGASPPQQACSLSTRSHIPPRNAVRCRIAADTGGVRFLCRPCVPTALASPLSHTEGARPHAGCSIFTCSSAVPAAVPHLGCASASRRVREDGAARGTEGEQCAQGVVWVWLVVRGAARLEHESLELGAPRPGPFGAKNCLEPREVRAPLQGDGSMLLTLQALGPRVHNNIAPRRRGQLARSYWLAARHALAELHPTRLSASVWCNSCCGTIRSNCFDTPTSPNLGGPQTGRQTGPRLFVAARHATSP